MPSEDDLVDVTALGYLGGAFLVERTGEPVLFYLDVVGRRSNGGGHVLQWVECPERARSRGTDRHVEGWCDTLWQKEGIPCRAVIRRAAIHDWKRRQG